MTRSRALLHQGRWCLAAALPLLSGCASFPDLGISRSDQLTAALTDVRESTAVSVALEALQLAPFRIPEDGSGEPLVEAEGRHPQAWMDEIIASALADRICERPDTCTPSPSLTIVALSRPYAGRRGAFVDARVRGVTDTGTGLIRYTRFIRLQMEKEAAGWRVVAATPLWETMG